MPKALIKILILLVAAGLVCFIVLLFINTRMEIPEIKDLGNPHLNEIRKNYHVFDSSPLKDKQIFILSKENGDSIEARYYDIICMLDIFKKEGFLTNDEYFQQKDSFWICYSNFFLAQCKCLFSQDEWTEPQRDFVRGKVKSLESEYFNKENNGHGDIVHRLDEATKTCNDYEKAERLIWDTEYCSLSSAKDKINRAKELVDAGRLSNCGRLSSALADYPNAMGNACYDKIGKLHARLSNWNSYSMKSTLDTYDNFCSLCSEYEDTTSGNLFGNSHPKDISNLKVEALNYKNKACDEKCVLTVNDYSKTCNSSWSSSAGQCTYNVKTDHPDGYSVQDLSSWFRVMNKYKNSFTISYDKNSKTDNRKDWFTVSAGNKKVKVNITQAGEKSESAYIRDVSVAHNVYENGEKGMNVTVYFTANNCYGKKLAISLYYYFNNGNALKDYNGQYKTTDGNVAVSGNYTPWQSSVSASKTIFMPYDELHMGTGKCDLKFNVLIWDGNTQLCRSSSYTYFTFTK